MNRTLTWLSAALILGCLPAQDDPGAKKSADAHLQELESKRGKIIKQWREDIKKASEASKNAEPGKPVKAIAMRPDFSPLRGEFLAGAETYPDAAVRFLVPALNYSSKPEHYREVLDILVNEHLDDEDIWLIGSFLPRLERMVGADYRDEIVAKIKAGSENPRLMTWLTWMEAEEQLRAYSKAKAKMLAALEKGDDPRIRQQFEQLTTETEKFGIGSEAPDIAGVDLDGVKFKLSDYKGKVVFLDFWGDW